VRNTNHKVPHYAFSAAFHYFLPLMSKYFPPHPELKRFQPCSSLNVTGPVSCQCKIGGKNTTIICVSFRSLNILQQILKNIIKGINYFTSLTFK